MKAMITLTFEVDDNLSSTVQGDVRAYLASMGNSVHNASLVVTYSTNRVNPERNIQGSPHDVRQTVGSETSQLEAASNDNGTDTGASHSLANEDSASNDELEVIIQDVGGPVPPSSSIPSAHVPFTDQANPTKRIVSLTQGNGQQPLTPAQSVHVSNRESIVISDGNVGGGHSLGQNFSSGGHPSDHFHLTATTSQAQTRVNLPTGNNFQPLRNYYVPATTPQGDFSAGNTTSGSYLFVRGQPIKSSYATASTSNGQTSVNLQTASSFQPSTSYSEPLATQNHTFTGGFEHQRTYAEAVPPPPQGNNNNADLFQKFIQYMEAEGQTQPPVSQRIVGNVLPMPRGGRISRGGRGGRRGRPRKVQVMTRPQYEEADPDDPEEYECLICHEAEPFPNRTISCGHRFHRACLNQVNIKNYCPACQAPVERF